MEKQLDPHTIALFGEAEKGEYQTPYYCWCIPQLLEYFGNPPPQSRGIYYAIQALLFDTHLIFLRVREEGFSYQDYLAGLHLLQHLPIAHLSAICLPGVGNVELLDAVMIPLSSQHHTLLITNEADMYDFLTATH